MIHYHGIPITPEAAAAQILMRRHAMVSFAHPEQIELVADVCQSFALDNGAFSAWRSGTPVPDWTAFYGWVRQWRQHPGFDWFLIPDAIDGTEAENALCDVQGRPRVKLHGLRMLDPQVLACFPFASADSTNVARNIGLDSRWRGSYQPATKTGRGVVLADRIEAFNSSSRWRGLRYELCSPLPLFADLLAEVEEIA